MIHIVIGLALGFVFSATQMAAANDLLTLASGASYDGHKMAGNQFLICGKVKPIPITVTDTVEEGLGSPCPLGKRPLTGTMGIKKPQGWAVDTVVGYKENAAEATPAADKPVVKPPAGKLTESGGVKPAKIGQ